MNDYIYSIYVPKKIIKQLSKIPKQYQKSFNYIIENKLPFDPYIGKKLQGNLSQYYSIRRGEYRLLYEIDELIIKIIKIDHRKNAYKIWSMLMFFN